MAVQFEQAKDNLKNLIQWYSQHVTNLTRNESTTRLHLINRIFFECLGWDIEDCKTEDRFDGQYADYAFYCPECLLIVEAKKEGVYFELPIGKEKLKYNLDLFTRWSQDVAAAIKQVVEYCQSRGTPYGIVCNGHQLVAFIASRNDGCPPLKGRALVFDSLESLEKNFLLAWNCLSKYGIMSRTLSVELQDIELAPVPEKLSAIIAGYPGYKRRNTLQTDLEILADLFIEDIAHRDVTKEGEGEEFLRECYCQSGALSQYASVSKELLRARYSVVFQEATGGPHMESATTKRGPNPEMMAQALSQKPIILIGDRGVGKTMFIKHLYRVDATDIFLKAMVFYIDFGSKPTFLGDLSTFVEQELVRQLLDNYGIDIYERNIVYGVLHKNLDQFERSIYADLRDIAPEQFKKARVEYIESIISDKDEYLRLCLEHISKGHRKQVVIFLDNVDQRPDDFQESVFLAGQTMAASWPVVVFVSIRPETFHKSQISGTLSAYHPRAFTVSPPRVDEVVVKRLKYGIRLLSKSASLGLGERISVTSESLRQYLEVLVHSFVTNKSLVEFLDNMCGGNIRLALDFIKAFIGSGHVDTNKILTIYKTTGRYTVPLHEFVRAIIYVDHEDYYPSASSIVNIFDISVPDEREHFLCPMLLAQMGRWATGETTIDGFVPTSEIYSYLQGLGFNPHQINTALERLNRRNLIESNTKSREYTDNKPASHYRTTAVGAYYVNKLMRQFEYVDAMTVDTPIVDQSKRMQIDNARGLSERLERTKVFCDYLDSCWSRLSGYTLAFGWPAVKQAIYRNIEYITEKMSLREDTHEPVP